MADHDLDPVSLIAGVAFAGLGVITLLGLETGITARWSWPVLLILVGIVGLIASRRGASPKEPPG